MPMDKNGDWGDYEINLSYIDMPEGTDDKEVYEQIEEIWSVFTMHLADRLNAKLPGKWTVKDKS